MHTHRTCAPARPALRPAILRNPTRGIFAPTRWAVAACLGLASLGAAAQARLDEPMAAGLIIKFREGARSAVAVDATMQGARAYAQSRGLAIRGEREASLGARVLHLERHVPASSLQAIAQELQYYDSAIEYVQPNYVLRPSFTPNDSLFPQQWSLTDPVAGIAAPKAWDFSLGQGARVAVLDTGVRLHIDLVGNILPGYDFISSAVRANDKNGRDADYSDPGDWVDKDECGSGKPAENSSWHGTHVSGIVAATGNNTEGISGVAPKAKVLPVRVLGRCGGTIADIADGALWAAGLPVPGVPTNAYPARIVNLSLGVVASCGNYEQAAITKLVNLGVLVVVAAGNDNINASKTTPANCKGVFAVAASNMAGGKAGFSNYGSTVAIAAPGTAIGSTANMGVKGPGGDNYLSYSGTSMAAPHVAGVAALMASANTSMPMNAAKTLMMETATPFTDGCTNCGAGIVHAERAVMAARVFRAEKEPNNTLATAHVLVGARNDVWGAIQATSDADDEDLYMVTVPPRSQLSADMINQTSSFDIDVHVLDKTGKLMFTAKSGGAGKPEYVVLSNIDYDLTNTYYLKVIRGALSARSTQAQAYRLKVMRAPLPY